MVDQRLVVGIDGTEAVPQKVELILDSEGRTEKLQRLG
jgi:hypothetical protein